MSLLKSIPIHTGTGTTHVPSPLVPCPFTNLYLYTGTIDIPIVPGPLKNTYQCGPIGYCSVLVGGIRYVVFILFS